MTREELSAIRAIVHSIAQRLTLCRLLPCGEVALLRGGRLIGIRFKFVGVRAVYLVNDHAVRFYDMNGGLLRISPLGDAITRREAA